MPEDVEIRFYDLSYFAAEAWDTRGSRVTLAGDATYSIPPNRGQEINPNPLTTHSTLSLP